MTPLNAFSVALSCTIEQLWYFSVLWYELHWMALRLPRAPMYLLRNSRLSKTVAWTHSGSSRTPRHSQLLLPRRFFWHQIDFFRSVVWPSCPSVCRWVVKPVSLIPNSKTLKALLPQHRLLFLTTTPSSYRSPDSQSKRSTFVVNFNILKLICEVWMLIVGSNILWDGN